MNKITVINSITCKADKELIAPIKELLTYKATYWKRKAFGAEKIVYDKHLINKQGIFLYGFLPKVMKYLKNKKIKFEVVNNIEPLQATGSIELKGITLREDQKKLILQAITKQRGVIKAPTAFGKSYIMLSIISAFPNAKVLLLCHSVSILKQLQKDFKELGFGEITIVDGNNKKFTGEKIVLASIQSFSKLNPKFWCDYFDINIIEECHHCNSIENLYGEVLQLSLSPMKIGVTATLPEGKEKLLALEGLLGPVIGEVTIQEGADLNILAKPIISLIPVEPIEIDSNNYNQIYQQGIINNKSRNKLIAKEAIKRARNNKTCLIFVKIIEHGKNLMKIFNESYCKYLKNILFIQGSTENEIREEIRNKFNDKELKIVICTAVWDEGVNIKSLDCCINASGGKSEIKTLQKIGRGLRLTEDKNEVEIIDFLDEHKYLSSHCIKRIGIYVKNGWL